MSVDSKAIYWVTVRKPKGEHVSLAGVASGANWQSFVGYNCQTSRSESPVATLWVRVPLPLQTSVRVHVG